MTDDPFLRTRNVALLIDADNASPDSLDPVLTVLAELGTVNIRRAYGNWQKAGAQGLGEDRSTSTRSSRSSSSTSPRARAPPT